MTIEWGKSANSLPSRGITNSPSSIRPGFSYNTAQHYMATQRTVTYETVQHRLEWSW